jgi:hypothetical protein
MKIGEARAHLAIKVWPEMHENLKWLSQIGEPSLKFKNQKQFLFRTKNNPNKSHATVPLKYRAIQWQGDRGI